MNQPFASRLGLVCCLITLSLSGDNWPAWRGADGLGIVKDGPIPLHWGAQENVKWKAALPAPGNSTPVVWGDCVFVTQANPKTNERMLMCFDRGDGALKWKSGVVYDKPETTHRTNPYCAASPVTDGERVVVTFASAGVFCFDFEGNEVWRRDLGPQVHEWGNASSPVLYQGLCLLYHGPGEGAAIVAMDKNTGRTVWTYQEPAFVPGPRTDGFKGRESGGMIGSFSTPLLIKVAGQEELVMSFSQRVQGLNPLTGKLLWNCEGLNPLIYTSPIFGENKIVCMGGFKGTTIALQAGGRGDISESHLLWEAVATKNRLGCGIIYEGAIYVVNMDGIAQCLDLASGEEIWEERVEAAGADGTSWSSMILAGEHLLVPNKSGDVVVLKASKNFDQVAVNSLGETMNSSIAVSDGELFIRTDKHLWCLGQAGDKVAAR